MLKDERRNDQVKELRNVADGLGCSLAQLALAWCAANENVSTVITGASRPEQVVDNFGAIDVLAQLTPEILKQMRDITR
jgi:aryl-alcohol dehydrogenase-like predicted oxidoreductase